MAPEVSIATEAVKCDLWEMTRWNYNGSMANCVHVFPKAGEMVAMTKTLKKEKHK